MGDRWNERFAKDSEQNENRNEQHHARQIVEQELQMQTM